LFGNFPIVFSSTRSIVSLNEVKDLTDEAMRSFVISNIVRELKVTDNAAR